MSSTPLLPSLPALRFDKTLGALDIGFGLNAFLYGIATVQYSTYHQRSSRDHSFLKSLIFLLWIQNSLGLILYTVTTYWYTVTNFLHPQALLLPHWSILADWLVGLFGDCAVTGVYAFRVWKLGNEYRVAAVAVIGIMTLFSFCTGLAFFSVALGQTYLTIKERWSWMWYATFGGQLVADVIITTTLCRMLYQRRTGIRFTDSLIRVLILYTINTCALTTVMRLGSILSYALGQDTYAFITVSSLLPRIIFSSLLALLNSRGEKRARAHNNGLISIRLSKLRHGASQSDNSAEPSTKDRIRVDTTTDTTVDTPTEIAFRESTTKVDDLSPV